jgi:hypothetical protein
MIFLTEIHDCLATINQTPIYARKRAHKSLMVMPLLSQNDSMATFTKVLSKVHAKAVSIEGLSPCLHSLSVLSF